MIIETKVDYALREELVKIKNEEKFINFIFNYCETQSNRERLLNYILDGHAERKEVSLMASQLGIESGTVEGELEEE